MNNEKFCSDINTLFEQYNQLDDLYKLHTDVIISDIINKMKLNELGTISYLQTADIKNIYVILGYLDEISEEFQSYGFIKSLIEIFTRRGIEWKEELYYAASTIKPKVVTEKSQIIKYLNVFYKQIMSISDGITEFIGSWEGKSAFPRKFLHEWVFCDFDSHWRTGSEEIKYYICYPSASENVVFSITLDEHVQNLKRYAEQPSSIPDHTDISR